VQRVLDAIPLEFCSNQFCLYSLFSQSAFAPDCYLLLVCCLCFLTCLVGRLTATIIFRWSVALFVMRRGVLAASLQIPYLRRLMLVGLMPASNGSSKECAMDDGFPKMELEVRTQVRSVRTRQPTNVAGCRDRRLSSCRRLKKERGMSSRCSTASSEAATVVQDGSRSVPPSTHRSNQSSVRTGGSFLTEASPRVDTSPGGDSITMKDRQANLGKTARTSSLTERFRSRCNKIKLRSVVHCIGPETEHSTRSPNPEEQEEEVETTDAVTCFRSTRGEQKKKSKGTFCTQTESTVSSPIKALFTETPFKPCCKVTSPVSTAFTRIFKVRLLKQKSAPALMSDESKFTSVMFI